MRILVQRSLTRLDSRSEVRRYPGRAMPEQRFSAQVLLRSPPQAEGQPATAETVRDLLPSSSCVQLVQSYFRSRGFEVSPAFGTSFSITGPDTAYDAALGQRVQRGAGGAIVNEEGASELRLDRLPADVTTCVQGIVFPPSPDFGPTSF